MKPQAPAEIAGRAFDFPSGYNLVTRPRAYEGTSFAELRALADSYDLIRLIIETRKDQIERLAWSVRPRDRAAAKSDPRLAAIAALFACPDGVHPWTTWLRLVLEDLLVIDAPALYLRRTRDGRLCALEPLDGATIKRVIDDWGRTPAPPDPAYQQVLKGLPAVDYTTDELLYLPRNPRIHKVYGYGPVEQVQMTVSIALRRQIWQLQYYTEGNIPEALIGVPDAWTPDQIRQFQGYWDSLHEGNTAARRHAKFVPGGVAKTFIPTREPALKDPFDEWLARVVCYAFSVSPQPFVPQLNRATAETAQDAALAEGLLPLKAWVKQLCDRVIAREFAAPDLEFAWSDDQPSDPAKVASVAVDYVKAGIKSVNEVRAELGLDPVPGGDRPAVETTQGAVPLGSTPVAPKQEPLARFNPSEARDWHGRWTTDGAGSGPIQPTALDPRKVIPLLRALGRWMERAPPRSKEPTQPPANAEPPSNGQPKPSAPSDDYNLPANPPTERSGVYHAGVDAATRIKESLSNDWQHIVQRTAEVVDSTKWLIGQVPNIVVSVDTFLEGPKDLSELIESAKGPSQPGYQNHHIVEQGPQNDDLSPEEKRRINSPEDQVRIPVYEHQGLTNYYRNYDRRLGMTPRQYLRGKSFDERYQFGLEQLRKRGLIK